MIKKYNMHFSNIMRVKTILSSLSMIHCIIKICSVTTKDNRLMQCLGVCYHHHHHHHHVPEGLGVFPVP